MASEVTEAQLVVARPYALDVDEVVRELAADRKGLTSDDAGARLALVGRNELPEPQRKPAILRFLAHFNDTLIYILLAAAVIKALMGDWLDFWVIMAVAIINSTIGYIQEGRAEKALAGIRGMLSADASVRRDGAWATVPAAELVPGDVIRLMPGDKVPADVRLFQAFQLRIDESALTGESVPSSKVIEPVAADAGVGDRTSMAFSGTIVSAGQGRGIVTSTGLDDRDRQDPDARGRGGRARDAAHAPARRLRPRAHHRDPRDGRGDDAHRQVPAPDAVRRAHLGCDRVRGRGDPRGTARARDDHSRARRAADGPAERHHPQAPRRRGAGLGDDGVLRQDRHADQERDDRPAHRHAARRVRRDRARLRPDGRDRAASAAASPAAT